MSISVFWDVTLHSMMCCYPSISTRLLLDYNAVQFHMLGFCNSRCENQWEFQIHFFTFFEGHINSTLWEICHYFQEKKKIVLANTSHAMKNITVRQ